MKQEQRVLPVVCKECGSVFDLWRELQRHESRASNRLSARQQRELLLSDSLCANCRANALDTEEQTYEVEIEFE